MGNLSFSCVETHAVPVFFNATSYLQLPGRANRNEMSVSFQFRTWNPSGLLLYSTFAEGLGMVEVDLNEGKVSAHINLTQTKKSRIDISSAHHAPATPVDWPGDYGLVCKLHRAALSSDTVAVGWLHGEPTE
ncbi:UNVERIFIED_CONTAM: hypothetical protein FKN15_050240 [Acipenser sinensis]